MLVLGCPVSRGAGYSGRARGLLIDRRSRLLYSRIIMNKTDIKQKLMQKLYVLKKIPRQPHRPVRLHVRGTHNDGSARRPGGRLFRGHLLFEYVHLSDDLSGILNRKVDLVNRQRHQAAHQARILGEVEWIEGIIKLYIADIEEAIGKIQAYTRGLERAFSAGTPRPTIRSSTTSL